MPPLLFDLDLPALGELLASWGQPAYRAKQIWQGVYQNFWSSPEEFSNLPLSLRQHLKEGMIFSSLKPSQTLISKDGETTKTLFILPDQRAIETVLMRYNERNTLCISTQAGCAMGCVFCATGQMGFKRHLTSGEIVEQVMYYARLLHTENQEVTNVVVMGMGEPFHNYDNTIQAIDRLNNAEGLNLGARRFTISTVGIIPMIQRFAQEKRQINLAISLHAASDALRSSMLPINKKYPLADLINACKEYIEMTGRRVTFEWALIQGVNDTPAHAQELIHLIKGMLCHVNIIPLNPTTKFPGEGSTRERAESFRLSLDKAGIPCTIRIRRGIDIQAGCGQLATQHLAQ